MRSILLLSGFFCFTALHAQTSGWIQTGIRDTVLDIDGENNIIWIATEHQGVKRFDFDTGEIHLFNNANTTATAQDIRAIAYAHGIVYAGSYDQGLFIYDGTDWTHADTGNSMLPGNRISDLLVDPADSSLWIATHHGLAHKTGDDWVIYDSLNSGIAGNTLTCLHRSADGTLWIGTKYSGMSRFFNGEWETYSYANAGINDDHIRTIAEDTDGFLYVADTYGVNKYDIADDNWVFVFTMYTAPMTSEKVNRIAFDSADTFWMAAHYGVMRADSANYWTLFYAETSDLPHNTTDALYIDAEDRAWIGTYGGLAYYDDVSAQPVYDETEISVYPNPAHDMLFIHLKQSYTIAPVFRIYDLGGKCVRTAEGSTLISGASTYMLPIGDLAPGMYALQSAQHTQTVLFNKL